MYCMDCGEKLTLRFLENEGLVPYCPKCEKFKFPFFPVAVSMTVVNRSEDKILLARHVGDAEKALVRELREETRLNAVKWRYHASRYHEQKDLLMLNYIVTADENAETVLNEELTEVKWCTPEEAKELIRKNSTAEHFLLGAFSELHPKKK